MAETTKAPELERITIRNMDRTTWRRFKAEAALAGKELGLYLSGVLVDWLDYCNQERVDAAKR